MPLWPISVRVDIPLAAPSCDPSCAASQSVAGGVDAQSWGHQAFFCT